MFDIILLVVIIVLLYKHVRLMLAYRIENRDAELFAKYARTLECKLNSITTRYQHSQKLARAARAIATIK